MKKWILSILGACCLTMLLQAQILKEKDFKTITMEAGGYNFRQITLYACSDYEQAQAGDEVKVGLLFRIAKGWNIYDHNKTSESYLPTEVEWQLPEGCKVMKETWQQPVKLFSDSEKMGYFDYCLVVVTIRLGKGLPEQFRIKATASWQVCNHLTCVPGTGEVTLTLHSGKKQKTKCAEILKKW